MSEKENQGSLFGKAAEGYQPEELTSGNGESDSDAELQEVPEKENNNPEDNADNSSSEDDRSNYIPDDSDDEVPGDGVPPDAQEYIDHPVKNVPGTPGVINTEEESSRMQAECQQKPVPLMPEKEQIPDKLDENIISKIDTLLETYQHLADDQKKIHADIQKLIQELAENNAKLNSNLNNMPVFVKNHVDFMFKDYFEKVVKNFNAMKKASFVWYKNMDNEKSEAAKKIYSSAKLVPYTLALVCICLVAIIIK